MIRNTLLILFFFTISSVLYAQNPKPYKSYFGFNLMQSVSGGCMEHFAIIRVYNNGEVEHKIISRRNWMMQFAGHQESDANPEGVNLFLENNISVKSIEYLWKLHFSEYPYKSQIYKSGWANKSYSPSEAQMKYLKKYGFETTSTFIYGDKAIELLKDMMSPEWVDNYSSLE